MKSTFRLPSIAAAFASLVFLTNCDSTTTDSPSPSTPPSSPKTETPKSEPPKSAKSNAPSGEDKDVDYMVQLGVMKGRLIVAQESINADKADKAVPHLASLAGDIYSGIEAQLTERKVPEFKTTLSELQELVKSQPKDAKVPAAFEASTQAIEKAIATLPADKLQSPAFVLPVITKLLNMAASDYKAAIVDGKIADEIKYQESRGLALSADNLYGSIAEPMTKENPEAHETIVKTIAALEAAWPDATPPETPAKTPEEVADWVKKIEDSAAKVIKK